MICTWYIIIEYTNPFAQRDIRYLIPVPPLTADMSDSVVASRFKDEEARTS